MKSIVRFGVGALVCAALASCGSDSGAKVTLNMVKNSVSSRLFRVSDLLTSEIDRVAGAGSNTAAQLTSMKYIFGFISICESLTTNGSAFSNPTGCVQIYNGPVVGDGHSDAVTPANISTYASSQIDLMDATSLAKLNSSYTLKSEDARTYSWAVVNWYTPIAVTAAVTIGSTTYNTKAARTAATASTPAITTADMTAGSPAETVVISPNGGSFFKFQTPFTISSADISAGTSFVVDMAFNPTGVISASSSQTQPAGSSFLWHDAGGGTGPSMYVPMLSLVPVPHKTGDTSKKETYTINLGSNAGHARVELYYAASDTTKAITGVNVLNVITSTDTAASYAQIDNGSKIASVTVETDGTITLKDNGSPANTIVSGLTRGAAGTCTAFIGGVASGSKSYTFDGTVDVM